MQRTGSIGWMLVVGSLLLVLQAPEGAAGLRLTFGQFVHAREKYLDCEEYKEHDDDDGDFRPVWAARDKKLKAVCKEVREKVDAALKSASLQIVNGELLHTSVTRKEQKIDTGHSCTVTGKMYSTELKTSFRNSGGIRLEGGNAISEPAVFVAEFPVTVRARANGKFRYGRRFLGSCSNYGSDSFSTTAEAHTTAKVAIAFSLEARYHETDDGDLAVSIAPELRVVADLKDVKLRNFRTHGVNPITGITLALAGQADYLKGLGTRLLMKNPVKEFFAKARLAESQLKGAVLTTLGLGGPGKKVMEYLLQELLLRDKLEENTLAASDRFENNLQTKLWSKVKSSLGLDATGKRTWVFEGWSLDRDRLVEKAKAKWPGVAQAIEEVRSLKLNCKGQLSFLVRASNSAREVVERYEVEYLASNGETGLATQLYWPRATFFTISVSARGKYRLGKAIRALLNRATKYRIRFCNDHFKCSRWTSWLSLTDVENCRPVTPPDFDDCGRGRGRHEICP